MIRVEHLTKVYDRRVAVDDLSFEVRPGEVLGLLGPNGAGKTTTLRAIAGILPPTRGTITVAGHDIVGAPIAAKSRLAWIPDDPHLFASLTVWEHLEFTAQVYGVRDWHDTGRALLARFDLGDRADTLADELSRGMRQKVATVCALLHDPEALLLDEPMTGLDPRGIRSLYEVLRERAASGAAVVVSSHLLAQLESLCTRYLILVSGKRLFFGSRDEILAQLEGLRGDATLEEIFFHATERGAVGA
ncbi:MAG: ABC transporter ATP-binding protein [Deltaproteobacteria bacterium]|jgi:ABC-2 type transport system ATP-binding protein|nr:ABC transporter ATP-binding protein [Deltaproteobacteria bacterium]